MQLLFPICNIIFEAYIILFLNLLNIVSCLKLYIKFDRFILQNNNMRNIVGKNSLIIQKDNGISDKVLKNVIDNNIIFLPDYKLKIFIEIVNEIVNVEDSLDDLDDDDGK